jgi:hypothetical protein
MVAECHEYSNDLLFVKKKNYLALSTASHFSGEPASSPRTVCADGAFDARYEHLCTDYSQDQPHDARDDLDVVGTEVAYDPLAGNEKSIGDQTEREKRPDRDEKFRQAAGRGVIHRRGNGAGTCEYGQGKRCDGDLEFRIQALLRVLLAGLMDPGVLAMKHVIADQKHQQSAGDAEGGQRDAEELEDEFTARAENEDDHEGGQKRPARDLASQLRTVVDRKAEKHRRIRDRIHDRKKTHENRCKVGEKMIHLGRLSGS